MREVLVLAVLVSAAVLLAAVLRDDREVQTIKIGGVICVAGRC